MQHVTTRARSHTLRGAVALALCVAALGAGCGGAARPEPLPSVSDFGGHGLISWSEAASRIGERHSVEGPVVDIKRTGSGLELSMGLPAPDPQRFVAIIPAADAPRFDPPPDAAYNGRLVKVWGTIKKRGAVATIVVTRPAQIVVEQ